MSEPAPLTVRRSIVVVSVALLVGYAVVIGALFLGSAVGQAVLRPSGEAFSGLGPALLGIAAAYTLGPASSVLAVAIGLRGRAGGARFTLVFTLVLVGCLVARFTLLGFVAGATSAITAALISLLWAIPAASVRLFQWRLAAVTALAGGLAVVIALAIHGISERVEQAQLTVAYAGPVFVPSDSPSSPLEGFRLRSIELPTEYNNYDGAVQISLSYVRPETEPSSGDSYYTVDLSLGQSLYHCGGDYRECPIIGTAHGLPVAFVDSSSSYLISTPEGVVRVEGYISESEALAVFNDLEPGTIDQIASLSIDPDYAVN